MKIKKSVEFSILALVLIMIFIFPVIAEEEISEIEKSYTCLKEQLGDNCGDSKNTEQNVFNLLAMAYDSGVQSDCKSSLLNKQNSNCWGDADSSVCKIKPTALSVLALNHIGQDVDNSVKYLLDKRKSNTGLTWFLEIDANNKTQCTINGKTFSIEENKKIIGTEPQGLKKAYNNYWFEIQDISKNYTISCDQDFISALLYQKPGSSVYYVSSKTNSAAAHDSVTERVESYCFSIGSECDYEGSLWTTLALANVGEPVSVYLPYLTAMADESINKKYFPSTFLYILTGADDYYSEIITLQKQGKYWDEGNNKLYDTSLALLGVQNSYTDEVDNTKAYLLSLRESSGCWNSNTALLLYSGWPKSPYYVEDSSISDCTSYNYFCVPYGECSDNDKLDNFYCSALSETCCQVQPIELSCDEKQGIVCNIDEECTGSEVIAGDTNYCCLDSCIVIEEENQCEELSYICKSECNGEEQEMISYSDDCEFGDVCCGAEEKKQTNWLLIIFLIILIILVILAIIFRNQLKVWLFRIKNKVRHGKGPSQTGRPSMPPSFPGMASRPGPARRPINRRVPVRARGSKDKEFDDTMRKLREMSK